MLKNKKRTATAAFIAAAAVIAAVLAPNRSLMRFFRQEVVISIAGDILLDRGVADELRRNGPDYPYAGVSQLFKQDDITVANLECPLTLSGGGAMKAKRIVFKADPSNADILKSSGFDALMLANNHTMDYLCQGLDDTMKALGDAGLLYAGAGRNRPEIQPCFFEKNGIRVGMLSYSSLPPEGFVYDSTRATIAYARAGYLNGMKEEVAAAAAQCDFLIVFFHWGIEYRHDVSDMQLEIAHAAVDSGASVIVGAHPHVLQGKEIYKGTPIYYSVGNFIFDKQIPEGTDETIILRLTVGKNGILDIGELPAVIKNCRPELAEGQKADEIRADLTRYSRRFEP